MASITTRARGGLGLVAFCLIVPVVAVAVSSRPLPTPSAQPSAQPVAAAHGSVASGSPGIVPTLEPAKVAETPTRNAPPILEIMPVKDPESAVTDALAERYGLGCMMGGDILVRQDPAKLAGADAKMASRGLTSGWVDDGGLFAGDRLAAVKAFGAVEAFADEYAVWVIVVKNGETSALQLVPSQTPAGHTVWAVRNRITHC
jgi:hypothetical protein